MLESYFAPAVRITPAISETVIPGNHITLEGIRFERLDKKPRGRSILRRLKGLESEETFIIYS